MLSVVIPVRDWPADRIEACVKSFTRLKSTVLTEIIVVDFGSKKAVKLRRPDKRVRMVRVAAERWSLAEANNIGVLCSRSPIVAKTDADIIIARESGSELDRICEAIHRGQIDLALARTLDLPPDIDASAALNATTSELRREARLRARWCQGTLCVFAAATWDKIGGFDYRFTGWGSEDNDFVDRVRKSGGKVRWSNQDSLKIFHVWHEPNYASPGAAPATKKNRELYQQDRSVFRPVRFVGSCLQSLAKPHIARVPRPLVTVAIATRARPGRNPMLKEAVSSFVGQIDNDFEVLIADNGSTRTEHSGLRRALSPLRSKVHLRFIEMDTASIPAARNRLTDEAQGRYICVVDDDDLSLPGRLSDHLTRFEKEEGIHGSHGGWIEFDQVSGRIEHHPGKERTIGDLLLGWGKVTCHSASFFRKDVLEAVRYDESYVTGSDWDLALRMAQLGVRVSHTGTYVALRRWHQENISLKRSAESAANGSYARRRMQQALGNRYVAWLKKTVERESTLPLHGYRMDPDELLHRLPQSAGEWRILIDVSQLIEEHRGAGERRKILARRPGRKSSVPPIEGGLLLDQNSTIAGEIVDRTATIMHRPEATLRLVDVLKGDIGILDCTLSPKIYYISEPIKGAERARKINSKVELTINVPTTILSSDEFERRRTKGFDWNNLLAMKNDEQRLISRPFYDLEPMLSAVKRIPPDTLPGALLSIVADWNGFQQTYYLVTTTISKVQASTVGRTLGQFTKKEFEVFVGTPSGRVSAREN